MNGGCAFCGADFIYVLVNINGACPLFSIGSACHELRIPDAEKTWRLMYHLDPAAVVILEVFAKTTAQTPKIVIDTCKNRLKHFKSVMQAKE